jgi:hypothetical protein
VEVVGKEEVRRRKHKWRGGQEERQKWSELLEWCKRNLKVKQKLWSHKKISAEHSAKLG